MKLVVLSVIQVRPRFPENGGRTVSAMGFGCGICIEVCPGGDYELTSTGVKTEGN